MGKFLFAVIALVVLLIAIVFVAPMLIPVSAYKARVETAASEALGREVTIGDGLSFRLVPTTAFHVNGLQIANAPGFDAPYLAKVDSADIGVKLFPLLSKKVEVVRFVLDAPDIKLERAKDGAVNWNLAKTEAAPAEQSEPAESGGQMQDLSLGDVRISNGEASYVDAAAGQKFEASDINVSARLESMAEPLEVHGAMTFEGAPSKIDLVLASLQNIVNKKAANLKLDIALGTTTAGADLVVNTAEGVSYSGPFSLHAPDLPALAKLLGTPLEDAPGFDKLSVEGAAQGSDTRLALSNAKINFDAIDAQGDLALDWSGAKPKATGQLVASVLDLRPYLPPAPKDSGGFPAWSTDKIDFGALNNINADLSLSADKILLNDMQFGESRLRVKIDDGLMTAEIPELGVYGGSGSGALTVDARKATPAIAGKFDVASVEAQPFSSDVLRTDRLLGTGGFNLAFNAQGASQAAIMRSLGGSGHFEIADGAIKGVNLAKLGRAVASLAKGGINPTAISSAISTAQGPSEQTDFSDFASQFAMTNGVVNATRVSLVGPFVTMSGGGAVNLPEQAIDLKLAPKISTAADNKSGDTITLPLRVAGSFSEPKLAIDIQSLLGGNATDAVKGLIDQLGGKKKDDGKEADDKKESPAAAALGSILGSPSNKTGDDAGSSDEPKTGDPKSSTAADALNKLFKPKKPADKTKEPAEQDPSEPEKTPQ